MSQHPFKFPAAATARPRNLRFGPFRFDPNNGLLTRNGADVTLAPRAVDVLRYLLERQGDVVSKQELLDEAWPDVVVEEATPAEAVSVLRKALDDDPHQPTYIQTLHRRGYRFIAPVSVDDEPESPGSDGSGPLSAWRRSPLRIAATLAVAALIVAAFVLWSGIGLSGLGAAGSAPTLAFEERDWVLIANFDNHTGETIFDGTLERALQRELANSRFVNVVPSERIQDTLTLMRTPPDTLIDKAMGREVSLRDGGISALVTGQVEKLGMTYVLSAQVVDPIKAVTVASVSEDADGHEQVLPAMRRLSNALRETLGEELSSIRDSDEQLARVTTPSLRALQLYTQADLMMQAEGRTDRAPAAALLQQAIALDPEFASAHILLAYCYQSLLPRPVLPEEQDELMRQARRAFELANTATEVEKYFIRAAYFSMAGQFDEMLANYEALLRVDPDHYWANHNVYSFLGRMLRFQEMAPYAVKMIELRPSDAFWRRAAGQALAILSNRPAEAEPYLRRAAELDGLDPDLPDSCGRGCWLTFYRVHQRWLRGDVEGVLSDVDRWAQRLRSGASRSGWAAEAVGSFYLALGKLEAAEETFRRRFGSDDAYMLAVAIARRGERSPGESVMLAPGGGSLRNDAWLAIQRARAGRPSAARELLSDIEARASVTRLRDIAGTGPYIDIARAEVALAEGHDDVPIAALREAVSAIRPKGDRVFFNGAEALARILVQRGDDEEARRVLEDAGRQRNRSYGIDGMRSRPRFAQAAWMNVRWELAQLYRQLGRVSQARQIEDELRELLVYADPDLWLLRQLQRVEESADGPASR